MTNHRSELISCTGKVRFASASLAHDIAKKRPCGTRAAYRCDFCGGWHLGRTLRTALAAQRRKSPSQEYQP